MEVQEAAREPQLAALSILAHGKGDPYIAAKIAVALYVVLKTFPDPERGVYLSLLENALSDDAREEFYRMMPEAPKYFSETLRRSWEQDVAAGKAEGEAKGKAEGEAKGEAKALLRVLAQRQLSVSEDQRRRILACTDLATLDGWLDRALRVASVDELLG